MLQLFPHSVPTPLNILRPQVLAATPAMQQYFTGGQQLAKKAPLGAGLRELMQASTGVGLQSLAIFLVGDILLCC